MTDPEAMERFQALYAGHHAEVYAYAVSRAGRQLADEVVSEVFLVAWRRLADVPAPALALAAGGGQEHGVQPVPRQRQAAVDQRRVACLGDRGRVVSPGRGRRGRGTDHGAHRAGRAAGGGPGTAHARRLARPQAGRGGPGGGLLDRPPTSSGCTGPGAAWSVPWPTRRSAPSRRVPPDWSAARRAIRRSSPDRRSRRASDPDRPRDPAHQGRGLRGRRRPDVLELLARARPASLDPGPAASGPSRPPRASPRPITRWPGSRRGPGPGPRRRGRPGGCRGWRC